MLAITSTTAAFNKSLVMWGRWLVSLLTKLGCRIPSDLNLAGYRMEVIDMIMTILGPMGVSKIVLEGIRAEAARIMVYSFGV